MLHGKLGEAHIQHMRGQCRASNSARHARFLQMDLRVLIASLSFIGEPSEVSVNCASAGLVLGESIRRVSISPVITAEDCGWSDRPGDR